MAFLATIFALLVLLGAILDLVVSTAAAIAQLTLLAIRNCMARLSTIEASLLAWWAILVTFLLAADLFNVALLATLRTLIILLRASVTFMVSASAALACLRGCAVRHGMACLTTIVALLLADRALLLLADRLIR